MNPDMLFFLAFLTTITGILYCAWGRKSQAHSSDDFSLSGRRAGSWSVSGAITGTLVGGASTIGTAQLAFLYGLSAWWFTLGAGFACLFLGIFLAVPLRHSRVVTIPEFISQYYGPRARTVASLYLTLGMFIQIVAQLLACGAILAVLFDLRLWQSATISSALVLLFTLGGGMKSAGVIGLVKMALIYVTMAAAGWLAYQKTGGWSLLRNDFPAFPWFSLFGYGVKEGLSDLLSMLVGVISTQTYLQAVFSARSTRSARGGALLSAAIIPPLGIMAIFVGLYMRRQNPDLQSALALPTFILDAFPQALAGIAFAALLIAAVGTASGLALGVATTLRIDLLYKRVRAESLVLFRLLTVLVIFAAYALLLGNLGSAIMDWSFLSMGLRGATLFFPLLFAVFLPKFLSSRTGTLAIVVAPSCVIVAGIFHVPGIPPLYLGLAVSLLILCAGIWQRYLQQRA